MEINKENLVSPGAKEDSPEQQKGVNRRAILKALAGIPVLGFFGYFTFKKRENEIEKIEKRKKILKHLHLDNTSWERNPIRTSSHMGDMLRVGFIGYGGRAQNLAAGLGYLHPGYIDWYKEIGKYDMILNQGNMNVAVTGICDVFDDHADFGLATARNEPLCGWPEKRLSVKRYIHYRDMLEDKNIDAVIIATPEHHHARMTIDALSAGKHVYCEKSFTRTEKEAYETYEALKNSKNVFQLGHQGAHNASINMARDIIKKGILGKVTLVEVTTNRNTPDGAWIRDIDANGRPRPGNLKTIDWDQWLGDRPRVPFSRDRYYNWTKWFDYSTGMLGQLFTHEYFTLNYLLELGIPHSVAASGGIYYWKDKREIPDTLQVAFEYPEKDMTVLYSASLASNKSRGSVIMGHDAWMRIGGKSQVIIDPNSTQFEKEIKSGLFNTDQPIISYNPGSNKIDAITSATARYYADRGLTYTELGGKKVDTTHLHLREWVECIRNGGTPSAGNYEKVFQESIVIQMAHKSYIEERRVYWDSVKRRIV